MLELRNAPIVNDADSYMTGGGATMTENQGRDEDLVKTSDELEGAAKDQDAAAQEEDEQPGDDEFLPDAPDGSRPAAT
jgi:hypothetical protein